MEEAKADRITSDSSLERSESEVGETRSSDLIESLCDGVK